MMPIIMIAFLTFANPKAPVVLKVQFNTIEACMNSAAGLVQNLQAAGMCIDQFTGATAMWGPNTERMSPDDPAPQENDTSLAPTPNKVQTITIPAPQ